MGLSEDRTYRNVFFRMLMHATGHRLRLHREGVIDTTTVFDRYAYTQEQPIADIGAAQLCRYAGF
ncbi:MAG: hypothetical protein R3B47_04995 [Bacteroidia bacterium]